MNNLFQSNQSSFSRAEKWDICFEALKKYHDRTGNYDVPSNCVTEDGVLLGFWCANIRKRYKKGLVAKDKVERLKKIGFDFTFYPERKWMQYYDRAVEYFNRYGDLNVPYGYVSDGCALGAWIPQQRFKYRNGDLSPRQIELLDALRIVWNPARDLWMRNYEYVRSYYIEHGHHIKLTYFTEDGYAIGAWLKNQRKKYYEGRLSGEQAELLEHIHLVRPIAAMPIRTDNLDVATAGGNV